jgi:predicted component of type VI protein secretion system
MQIEEAKSSQKLEGISLETLKDPDTNSIETFTSKDIDIKILELKDKSKRVLKIYKNF